MVICQERDGYRSIIDSYESEVTISSGGQSDTQLRQNLEDVISSLRRHNSTLETDVERMSNEVIEHKTRIILVIIWSVYCIASALLV